MAWLFNLVYATALICLSPWLLFRAITTGRYRDGWNQKLFGSASWKSTEANAANRKTIWLHGVSVGEVQLLKPLIEQLRTSHPEARFIVSTTTKTGMELALKLFTNTKVIYYPFDFSWAVNRVLDNLKPSLIVLGELELWPNFISAAHARKIPVTVVNARLSERSFRGYRRLSAITHSIFEKLSLVAAQDATYAQRFIECGVPADRVIVTGSVKFDNVNFDRQHERVKSLGELVGLTEKNRVWIVGSTQAPEEIAAAKCFASLAQLHPELRLIVVPRHPERFDTVFDELRSLGMPILRRSQLSNTHATTPWKILLVDTIGELRWWWGLADVALVGGSFGNRGGQNMLEPSAYGANVAVGPNTWNFRDIVQLLLEADALARLGDLSELLPWMESQLADPTSGNQRGQRAQQLVRRHQGALARTVDRLGRMVA